MYRSSVLHAQILDVVTHSVDQKLMQTGRQLYPCTALSLHLSWSLQLQLGFFNIVGIPLFKSFAELFPEAQPMLDGVLDNFKHWELGTAMEDLPP